MEPVAEQLEIRYDSEDEDERGEAEDDDHVEEHSEGLRGRVRREAEREHVGEGHNTEGEQQEDYDSCWVIKIECQEEDDCRSYSDVKFKRIEDEVSDPIRYQTHSCYHL